MSKNLRFWLRKAAAIIVASLIMQFVRVSTTYRRKLARLQELRKKFYLPKSMDHPVFGFIPHFAKHWEHMLHERAAIFDRSSQETGKKCDTYIMKTPFWSDNEVIVSRDPKLNRYILNDDFDNFVKSDVMRCVLHDMLGDGIFRVNHNSENSEEQDLWRFQRKTASKMFTLNMFKGHAHETLCNSLEKAIDCMNDSIASQSQATSELPVVEMKSLIYKLISDVTGGIAFGVDFNAFDESREVFFKAFDQTTQDTLLRYFAPGWNGFLGKFYPHERRITKNLKLIKSLAASIIEERKASASDDEKQQKGDILSLFLAADRSLSTQFIQDIVISFMLAGRDTTSAALTFVLFLLATHPNVQQKLFREISTAFPTFNGQDGVSNGQNKLNVKSLKKLEYLDAVVFETLRLFPPVPVNSKQANKDTLLPNGMLLRKGHSISYEPFAMGRDESRYENAGSFIPERWLKEDRRNEDFDAYEFPAFQAGPRMCLGKDLALFEMKMTIVTLLQKFNLRFAKEIKDRAAFEKDVALIDGEVVYQTTMTMAFKGGLDIAVEKR